MHTAGNQVISCAFRGALDQSRSLDLKEALFCQKCSCESCHAAAGNQIVLDIRPSQIQETVFQTQLFLCLALLLNREWRCLRLSQDPQGLCTDFNGSCSQIFIYSAGTGLYAAFHCHYKLAS